MIRFLGWPFALLLSACSVPNFGVLTDDASLGIVDPCGDQVALGKSCGGACPACVEGQSCDGASDCLSSNCEARVCVPAPTCTDGKTNGGETDTDCGGGTCRPCALTAHCTRASDCESALCDAGVCAPMPTCSDGVINGAETDTDCGGAACVACVLDAHCTRASDCESGLCKAGVCAVPSADATCTDTQKNGVETDTDCGGGTCGPCAVDKRCSAGSDCITLVCATVCQPPGCTDKVRNGEESDKDCGGTCAGCDVGLVCKANTDCKSFSCSGGHCLADTCTDKIKNGTETGTDCGNGCPACGTGIGCAKAADCQSLVCTSSKCAAATCSDGVKNNTESEVDCGKGCNGCKQGQLCSTGADCESATCTQNYCVPVAPSGGVISQAGWVATASDTASASTPKLGIDSNLASHWTSGRVQSSGMWYLLDMGKPQIFFSLTLDDTNISGDSAQLFDVFLSLTSTFSATPTVKGVAGSPSTKVTFPGNRAVVARYVKFVLTQNFPQASWSIQELTAGN
ncbi:MAG: discoidin domain-containing protein [Polyangiaceae bacterium]